SFGKNKKRKRQQKKRSSIKNCQSSDRREKPQPHPPFQLEPPREAPCEECFEQQHQCGSPRNESSGDYHSCTRRNRHAGGRSTVGLGQAFGNRLTRGGCRCI